MAQNQCAHLFPKLNPVSSIIIADPIQQLYNWEQLANHEEFRKPTHDIHINYVNVDSAELETIPTLNTSNDVIDFFKSADHTRWLKHPLNTTTKVPYLREKRSGFVKGKYSASASMFLFIGDGLYTIKLPSNYPHPKSGPQPPKALRMSDTSNSLHLSQLIQQYDRTHPASDTLTVLTEIFGVISKKGFNAFTVRDLRPLQNGKYYLPAFAIPFVGREIANANNEEFYTFWEKTYGSTLGRAKAQLLLRYGLEMITPNEQNWLIELDNNLKPTGRIIMRDVGDAQYVASVADQILKSYQNVVNDNGSEVYSENLNPNWTISSWTLFTVGFPDSILKKWGESHDHAYIDTIVQALHLANNFHSINELDHYLKTDDGVKKLKDFATKNQSP